MLDGASEYYIFDTSLKQTLPSQGVINNLEVWEKLKTGENVDFEIAQTNLDTFNSNIACEGDEYAFTNDICTSCISIRDIASFTAPSCVSDAQATNQLFTNLKQYITEETNFINRISNELGNQNQATTP